MTPTQPQSKLEHLRAELASIVERCSPGDGFHPGILPAVHYIKISQPQRRSKRHWRACLGIVAQGTKEIVLGEDVYRFDDAHYIATPLDLPVISRIAVATPARPFLCLLIYLDPLSLSEVAAHLEPELPPEGVQPLQAVFGGKATEQMLEASIRLAQLHRSSEEAAILGPLVIKEIFYHLLRGPEGLAIRQFVRSGSKIYKVSQAISALSGDLGVEVDVRALARAAHMSRSAFFKHFKAVTAVSPIQYQKRLRLLEARRLMIDEGETAESAAFRVGYKSASQFSREYSRMFADAPGRDTAKIKELGLALLPV
jgi:AraC-like DNA-binding protein